ncbi:MAG: di-trans,poly-cis-decaprenylcistransferase [Bacilli bacterium]|nr:di-trans,poly-cis-decaprenylcistransferase [Bacilli bacterium]
MGKKADFRLQKKLDHIAFIMDGNGRWANARGLPRHLGHKAACKKIREIFDACDEQGIKVVSLYAFSTENWSRPQDEIDHLMDYLEEFLARELEPLHQKGGKILISGDLGRIRPKTRQACLDAVAYTANNQGCILNICLNYGGRDEIVRAAKKLIEEVQAGKLDPKDIDESVFAAHLWHPLPDVDLMIRTSGESRLSNFLLYELAYAEFIFTPTQWPDFGKEKLLECLKEYESRDRRYGGLSNGK